MVAEMSLGKNNYLMLVFLAVTGQSMASELNFCHEDATINQSLIQIDSVSPHHIHEISAQDNNIENNICDCSQSDCFCPMGSCVYAALNTMETNHKNSFRTKKLNFKAYLTLDRITSSIYRPPISQF